MPGGRFGSGRRRAGEGDRRYTPAWRGGSGRCAHRSMIPAALPPPVTDELIARMIEPGPRYNVEWLR